MEGKGREGRRSGIRREGSGKRREWKKEGIRRGGGWPKQFVEFGGGIAGISRRPTG
jgi:hypothetical protein